MSARGSVHDALLEEYLGVGTIASDEIGRLGCSHGHGPMACHVPRAFLESLER